VVNDMAHHHPRLDLDRHLPVLVVKVGRYPLHHGAVAAIRSLGRLGVPVYAVTEDRLAPAGLSRYLAGRFIWPTTGGEQPEALLAGLRRIGRRLGRPTLVVATDDEAAALLATHQADLADLFVQPEVDPGLPGRLADKQGLYELCREHGVPAPVTEVARSAAELRAVVDRLGLPLVAKNVGPWDRLSAPVVAGTTMLRDKDDVAAMEQALGETGSRRLLVQEYLPPDGSSVLRAPDWFAHFYCYADERPPLLFTGLKLHSWPPAGGVTARGIALPNPQLAAAAADFCRAIGYRGVGDMDWRYDRRDGRLKLVDFNPRLGAQFQVFRTTAGIDLVRALHLDLSGRPVPAGRQIDARELIVEHLDAAAVLAGWLRRRPDPLRPYPWSAHREPAWFAWDDPMPFAMATALFAAGALRKLTRR
jgi:D-aspartate ligase